MKLHGTVTERRGLALVFCSVRGEEHERATYFDTAGEWVLHRSHCRANRALRRDRFGDARFAWTSKQPNRCRRWQERCRKDRELVSEEAMLGPNC